MSFADTHDLASTEDLDETKLSSALEQRYAADMIYTYVGKYIFWVQDAFAKTP